MTRIFLLTISLTIYISNFTYASDLAREQRLHDEIIDAILDGEPIQLDANGHSFLGIHTESATDEQKGGVIILHGRGLHPNWDSVVRPIRIALPEQGWDTLSIQMPVLAKGVKYYDYVPMFPEATPRIDAAIKYLRQQGLKKIVLVAHSCGAHMAMHWIDEKGDKDIDAYIGIGMGATDYKQPMRKPFPFAKMTVPILDIYGSEDHGSVVRRAPERMESIRQGGNKQSAQKIVKDADHDYTQQGKELVETISNWLGRIKL